MALSKTLHQKNDGTYILKTWIKPKTKWAESCVDKTDFVADIEKQFTLSVGGLTQGLYDTDIDPKLQTDLSSLRNLNDITEIEQAKADIKTKMKIDTAEAEKTVIKTLQKEQLKENLGLKPKAEKTNTQSE